VLTFAIALDLRFVYGEAANTLQTLVLVLASGVLLWIAAKLNAETALRQNQDRFRYAFDHSLVAMSITLPSGEMQVNRAFHEMLGLSRDEFLQRHWQEMTHPGDIEASQKIVDSILSGKTSSAIELARQIHPDVIVMDVSMPGVDGIQATRVIHAEWPTVRIVGLSMFREEEQAGAMREAGAVGYLAKSDPAAAILAAIRGDSPALTGR